METPAEAGWFKHEILRPPVNQPEAVFARIISRGGVISWLLLKRKRRLSLN